VSTKRKLYQVYRSLKSNVLRWRLKPKVVGENSRFVFDSGSLDIALNRKSFRMNRSSAVGARLVPVDNSMQLTLLYCTVLYLSISIALLTA